MSTDSPILSIIVPVYNVEKYLKKCITSILEQTFTNYEIILIDDGSTDSSGIICDEFSHIDKRIKVIHKGNSGAAESRNIGIKHAKGKYIGFVDSDDYIDKDMYETLYNLMQKHNSDISICGLLHEYKNRTINPYPHEEEATVSGIDALKIALIGDKFSVNVYNKIYKKELFENVEFPKLKFAEDAHVLIKLLYKAKTVAYNTSPKYHWIRHSGSVTTANFNEREWEAVDVYTENLKFIKENCPHLLKEALCRYYLAYFWMADKMAISQKPISKRGLKKALNVLRKGYFKIIFNPYFNINRKFAATALLINWKLYKSIIKFRSTKFN